MDYEVHFMIADENETYCLEFIDNRAQVLNITEKPYMTNFYLKDVVFNEDGGVLTPEMCDGTSKKPSDSNITDHGSGLERYNLIVENYSSAATEEGMRALMYSLNYTNAYKEDIEPRWLSEQVGTLTIDSPVEELQGTWKRASLFFKCRSRDSKSRYYGTWHTVHSSIYNIKEKVLSLTA